MLLRCAIRETSLRGGTHVDTTVRARHRRRMDHAVPVGVRHLRSAPGELLRRERRVGDRNERDPPLFWSIALGELGLAAALAIALGKWAKFAGASNGFLVGATIGFLMAVSYRLHNLRDVEHAEPHRDRR